MLYLADVVVGKDGEEGLIISEELPVDIVRLIRADQVLEEELFMVMKPLLADLILSNHLTED